jgi:hypothetical protein
MVPLGECETTPSLIYPFIYPSLINTFLVNHNRGMLKEVPIDNSKINPFLSNQEMILPEEVQVSPSPIDTFLENQTMNTLKKVRPLPLHSLPSHRTIT